ncbi:ABC transporter permease [Mobilitalea sibirica]|uniref:ABC transporter permease n=1 Tax=Mobilitalea sibirica TaxID=1462919 RepID=A0A8J7KUC5_9FIRM|nr:ABC transporter permease [Mobilitalea sibirica]MBH1942336.1 ABC transporter permease [Mobilitalea sibirica]
MKKSSISGWKNVYIFTLIQTLKNKAFIITYLLLIILMMVSMPIISMITSSERQEFDEPIPVKKVYVNNETSFPDMDFTGVHSDDRLSHISFETMKEAYDTVADRIEKKEQESVILTLTEKEGMYALNLLNANESPIKDIHMQLLGETIAKEFDIYKINVLGIKQEQLAMLHAEVETKVTLTDVNGAPILEEDTSITNSEYWFIYGILIVILFVNSFASGQIATSIVTEKSTRVVEYLLTSVKPLAIIIGKILAMLSAVLLQMISMVVILYASNKISTVLSGDTKESVLSRYLPENIFQNLNLMNIIVCFVLILLGLIFYGTLAALTGATISKLEEISEGLTLFTVTNIVGAYLGLGAANVLMASGVNGFVTFTFLFPLSAPFLLPGAILTGKVSLGLAVGAIALQIIFIILLFWFVAKVYETLILHTGNKIKVKELIKLSKTV